MAKRDKATRDGLREIRKALKEQGRPASEADAIAFAVKAVNDPDTIFLHKSDFAGIMANYAANAVSLALGKPHAPVSMPDGTIGFTELDGPMPDPPRAH